jgi:CO dehydrogenase maturation factor
MKIAVSGKGGAGKTTISATLARLFARRGVPVLAIDGDPNPNLSRALGITTDYLDAIPRSVIERQTDESGAVKLVLNQPASEIIDQYGLKAPDGVTLLLGSRVDHAGAG